MFDLYLHLNVRCVGVLRYVGQRLLHDPKRCGGIGLCQVDVISCHQFARYTAALGEVVHQPLNGGNQAQVIQQQWPQVCCDAPRGGDCHIHQVAHFIQFGGYLYRAVPIMLTHPVDVHFERGERLGQVVMQFTRDARLLALKDSVGFVGEGVKLRFGAHPLADIAQDDGEQFALGGVQLRNGGLNRKFLAIGAQAIKHCCVTHAPRGAAGAFKLPHMHGVSGAKAQWHQLIKAHARHVGTTAAKHLLSSLVIEHDTVRGIQRNDGVHRRIEQTRQLGVFCWGSDQW